MFVHGLRKNEDSSDEGEEEVGDLLQRRREECERKARRGEMDPRLEFTFQLLIDGTSLPRSDIMDHVFDGNMLDEINQLFLPHMRNKLLWFYQEVEEPEPPPPVEAVKPAGLRAIAAILPKPIQQTAPPKKKLFLTDGWQLPLTGICIYMFRLNTGKQLPEEGFHKDLFCGIVDASKIGLVTSVQRVMQFVFMEALAHPAPDADDDEGNCNILKNQLLPGLRSFCSALKVCEEVCDEPNLFDDGETLVSHVNGYSAARDMVRVPENLEALEERIKVWVKKVQEVLMESEQLRKENDSSGPQDELEYWKKRGAQFSQIVAQLQSPEVMMTLTCLVVARSKLIKMWKETDMKITFCYNEARDNAKFIQAMEKCCHSLYLHDPVRMKDTILSMLQTVRLIHSVSQFYNTSERTSSLMVKITNQMIEQCKQYITCRGKETIWSQDRDQMRQKLLHCIRLNRVYHNTYILVKRQPFLPEQTTNFSFSENYVFGKFDTFCDRLSKIISMFDLVDDYNSLFERRMEGLLLGEALEDAMKAFETAKAGVTTKTYDYLDQRNTEFDADFEIFLHKTDELKENIGALIEENFASVWESPQGIRFLTRFEKVSEKIPLTRMEDKYERVLKYCEQELERILKLFRRQRDDPPLPRNFPPIAGRIKWARSLHFHLESLVKSASAHPVLKTLSATTELVRRYNLVANTLTNYQQDMKNAWLNHNVYTFSIFSRYI